MENTDLLDQRLNAIINDEVKNIRQYGDRYFDSGTGLFGKLKQELGDSGQGRRAYLDAVKANRDMGGRYSNQEIFSMFNNALMENFPDDEKYRLSPSLLPKEKKADGGMPGDLDKDGKMSGYEQARQDAIEKSMREEKQEGGRIGYKDGTDELYSKILKEKVSQSDYQRKISMGSILAESEKQRDKIEDMKNEYESLFGIEYSQVRKEKQEGGEIDNQMSMLMGQQEPEQEMLPDEEMEDNYIDFILDEALTEEEEDMLMSKLEQDEQLSMLFDKVIEVASEFAGSGPVEGPGSGVSDSIPARLSDGEFVFTAKSVEEIGADNLMAMMKEAEMRADERQGMQNGGDVEEELVTLEPDQEPARQEIRVVKETVDSPNRMIADEDEISKSIKSNMMLDPMQRHVRS